MQGHNAFLSRFPLPYTLPFLVPLPSCQSFLILNVSLRGTGMELSWQSAAWSSIPSTTETINRVLGWTPDLSILEEKAGGSGVLGYPQLQSQFQVSLVYLTPCPQIMNNNKIPKCLQNYKKNGGQGGGLLLSGRLFLQHVQILSSSLA